MARGKLPPTVRDAGGPGVHTIEGYRFVEYGATRKQRLWLDPPVNLPFCNCRNPSRWLNEISNLSDKKKQVLPPGTTAVYSSQCSPCTQKDRDRNHEKSRRISAEAKEIRKKGGNFCEKCPRDAQGVWTRQPNGKFRNLCDYHSQSHTRNHQIRFEYAKTLINQETQAICKHCSGVFKKEDMMQTFVNVRGQTVDKRQVHYCPKHYDLKRKDIANFWKRHIATVDQEKQEDLEAAAEKGRAEKGCEYKHCGLDRAELLKALVKRHGETKGTRMLYSHFHWDCFPRRSDHRRVPTLTNKVERKRERVRCQVLCGWTCHAHKTWENFDMRSFEIAESTTVSTREQRARYNEMKLARFRGGPESDRPHEKGCMGYKDKNGKTCTCLFTDQLSHLIGVFEETNRLGLRSKEDRKYGFLTMFHCDHDNIDEKESPVKDNPEREMPRCTLRCGGCHWFKSLLCDDFKVYQYIPKTSTSLINDRGNSDDPATYVTSEDDFAMLYGD